MRELMQNYATHVLLVCLCAWPSGCATAPVAPSAPDTFVDPAADIVVAPLWIEYRNVHTNDSLKVAAEDRTRIEEMVGELVVDQLKANGFTVRLLTAEARMRIPGAGNGWGLCDETWPLRLLCLHGRFYVGPGGSWNPLSGAIQRGGSRLVLEGRLKSAVEPRIVWAQTVQVRESTDVSRSMLKDTVEVLLKTLKAQ